MAETARFNARSYFGLPAKLDDYETNPEKLGNTSTLSGALGGLAKAGVNGLVNAGVRTYNAVAATGTPTTSFEERNAAFPAANVRRYQPQGVAPAAAVLPAAPRPSLRMLASHTPGQTYAPAPTPQAVAPVAARPSLRRSAAAAPLAGNPPDPPQDLTAQTPTFRPTITEQTDASGVVPADWQARQAPTGGPAGYSADGTNGGFGFTRNADGTVDRMFTLRQRTAAEDLASPREVQAEAAPAVVDMSPGSQGAWEREQRNAALTEGVWSPRARAKIIQDQQALDETGANNLRTNRVSQQNADSLTSHYRTTDKRTEALLPGEQEIQGSALATARQSRLSQAQKDALELAGFPVEQAEKIARTGYYRKQGDAVAAKADNDVVLEKQRMIEEGKLKALEAKNNSPTLKADAAFAESLAPATGLLPSEAAAAVKGGYRKVQKAKSRWFGPDQKAGLVNDVGQLYDPAAPALPAGYRASGKLTPDGRPILLDAKGNKFVQ